MEMRAKMCWHHVSKVESRMAAMNHREQPQTIKIGVKKTTALFFHLNSKFGTNFINFAPTFLWTNRNSTIFWTVVRFDSSSVSTRQAKSQPYKYLIRCYGKMLRFERSMYNQMNINVMPVNVLRLNAERFINALQLNESALFSTQLDLFWHWFWPVIRIKHFISLVENTF